MSLTSVEYRINPVVSTCELKELFAASWPNHQQSDFAPVLARSLSYVCAYAAERARRRLVGYVNLAWDGGVHAFLLDTTVHPDLRRQGIGRGRVYRAIETARERGAHWVHVDFEPPLRSFYLGCGFRPSDAGVFPLS